MQRLYLNKAQPRRDEKYLHRTHIKKPDARYNPTDPLNIATQILIYRACREGQIISGCTIEDFHRLVTWDFDEFNIVGDVISKKRVGDCVVNAVIYNPRVLKGLTKTNHKNRMIYVFDDVLDLQYGLEWMICLWLYKLEPEDSRNQEVFEDLLTEIATLPLSEVRENYFTPATQLGLYIHWPHLWEKLGLYRQEKFIQPEEKPKPPKPTLSPLE